MLGLHVPCRDGDVVDETQKPIAVRGLCVMAGRPDRGEAAGLAPPRSQFRRRAARAVQLVSDDDRVGVEPSQARQVASTLLGTRARVHVRSGAAFRSRAPSRAVRERLEQRPRGARATPGWPRVGCRPRQTPGASGRRSADGFSQFVELREPRARRRGSRAAALIRSPLSWAAARARSRRVASVATESLSVAGSSRPLRRGRRAPW